MIATEHKILHMLTTGEYFSPEPFDDLHAGIRFASELTVSPWTPEDRRNLLRHWIHDASDLLHTAVGADLVDSATAFAIFAMEHSGGHGLEASAGVADLWTAADEETKGRYADKAKEFAAWMGLKP